MLFHSGYLCENNYCVTTMFLLNHENLHEKNTTKTKNPKTTTVTPTSKTKALTKPTKKTKKLTRFKKHLTNFPKQSNYNILLYIF